MFYFFVLKILFSRFDFEGLFHTILELQISISRRPDGGMVYTEVSKSSASRLAGSSPALGTINNTTQEIPGVWGENCLSQMKKF